MSEVTTYQDNVANHLKDIFGNQDIIKEWHVAKDSRDDFTRELYCPRLDVAVGPFNIDGQVDVNKARIRRRISSKRNIIKAIFDVSENNNITFEAFKRNCNENPRCMIAIEIENSGSSKHMLEENKKTLYVITYN